MPSSRPVFPGGIFSDIYGANADATRRIRELVELGWTGIELEPQELNRFFEMKDWCDLAAGKLGDEWINVNLRTFLFRRKDIAALFKLTFWPINV